MLSTESNHHIWRNRQTWWVAFTVLHDGHRQERVRRSLGTRDVALARVRRDSLIRDYAQKPGVALSIRVPKVNRDASALEATVVEDCRHLINRIDNTMVALSAERTRLVEKLAAAAEEHGRAGAF